MNEREQGEGRDKDGCIRYKEHEGGGERETLMYKRRSSGLYQCSVEANENITGRHSQCIDQLYDEFGIMELWRFALL